MTNPAKALQAALDKQAAELGLDQRHVIISQLYSKLNRELGVILENPGDVGAAHRAKRYVGMLQEQLNFLAQQLKG